MLFLVLLEVIFVFNVRTVFYNDFKKRLFILSVNLSLERDYFEVVGTVCMKKLFGGNFC